MSSSTGSYEDWAQAFSRAYECPTGLEDLACPSCGAKRLNLWYLTEKHDSPSGLFAFWCAQCLVGFPPGFTSVPPDATVKGVDQRGEVPDYATVIDPGF